MGKTFEGRPKISQATKGIPRASFMIIEKGRKEKSTEETKRRGEGSGEKKKGAERSEEERKRRAGERMAEEGSGEERRGEKRSEGNG